MATASKLRHDNAARAIRAFLNFCAAEKLIKSNPMARVKMPKVREDLLPAFSADNIRALLQAAKNTRDRALMLCLLDTGCRVSEFLAWSTGDINISTGVVRVRATKNGKERVVFFGTRARRELVKLLAQQGMEPDAPVWRSMTTGALDVQRLDDPL